MGKASPPSCIIIVVYTKEKAIPSEDTIQEIAKNVQLPVTMWSRDWNTCNTSTGRREMKREQVHGKRSSLKDLLRSSVQRVP